MRTKTIAGGIIAAALLISVGCPTALADGPYADLVVDPNAVTDSTAYAVLSPPIANPDGHNGVSTVYTHRDSTRTITDTILVLPDPGAAAAAVPAQLHDTGVGGSPKPAAVGTGGTMIAGTTPDGSRSLTVLGFAQGNAAVTLEFEGALHDAVPSDLAMELGQAQATLIKDRPPV
jgi:hypothetical protein